MAGFDETALWRTTLGPSDEPEAAALSREHLRSAYFSFRARAALLAAEIPQELREFTVHDASHLDALWETANAIAGPDIHLTPTEGFVLGGAILIHDLGMGLAAWPGGLAALKAEPEWPDIVALEFERAKGRPPTERDLADLPEEVERRATSQLLREAHAKHAERLAVLSWTRPDGDEWQLLDAHELRNTFGQLIGQIAGSHWWSVRKVGDTFGTTILGAPVGVPADWTVRPLLLACLLRAADASHLDARRAPPFLKTLRSPVGVAEDHWTFQEHLQQVQTQGDRLVYTAAAPFSAAEASSWWVCLESLRMVDSELRQIDALLADLRMPRFQVRSVAGVDDPTRLTKYIPTAGWIPVDAAVRVTDAIRTVRTLGGQDLYGGRPYVALRELVQNAQDAILALRAHPGGDPLVEGAIDVRLGVDADGSYLEVSDNGIGMSPRLMTGPLLDFGTSYWQSGLMREELPGLAATEFRAAGRFGIGFFSVFMIGDRVRITSRRFDAAHVDTHVLDFGDGLELRPIFRRAEQAERLVHGGTCVRVWLKAAPYDQRGILSISEHEGADLAQLLGWLCPALEVTLTSHEDEMDVVVVEGGDWRTCDPGVLQARIELPLERLRRDAASAEALKLAASFIRHIVEDDGTVVGRAAMTPERVYPSDGSRSTYLFTEGTVAVGGLRAAEVRQTLGVLSGLPSRAARDEAVVMASPAALSRWATEQAGLAAGAFPDERVQRDFASMVWSCGGDTEGLPIAQVASKFLSAEAVTQWAADHDSVTLITPYQFVVDRHSHEHPWCLFIADEFLVGEVRLHPHVLIAATSPSTLMLGRRAGGAGWPPRHWTPELVEWFHSPELWKRWWVGTHDSLAGLVVTRLAQAWDAPVEAVLSSVEVLPWDDRSAIGIAGEKEITLPAEAIIRRPT